MLCVKYKKQIPPPSVIELFVNYNIKFRMMKGSKLLRNKRRGNLRYGTDCVSKKYLYGRLKLILIVNRLSMNEKLIYEALVKFLGKKAEIDIIVYNNDFQILKKLLNQRKDYTHYVIYPHFNEKLTYYQQLIEQMPREKLIIIGEDVTGLSGKYSAVIENFGKNIFNALVALSDKLKKYKKLTLLFSNYKHPEGMKEGFVCFCEKYQFQYHIITDLGERKIQSGEVFIIPDDHFLIDVFNQSKNQNLVIGKDFGIISYNDSPLKEFIAGGLTTISTDFDQMGKSVAKLILGTSKGQIENPFGLIQRGSL